MNFVASKVQSLGLVICVACSLRRGVYVSIIVFSSNVNFKFMSNYSLSSSSNWRIGALTNLGGYPYDL